MLEYNYICHDNWNLKAEIEKDGYSLECQFQYNKNMDYQNIKFDIQDEQITKLLINKLLYEMSYRDVPRYYIDIIINTVKDYINNKK